MKTTAFLFVLFISTGCVVAQNTPEDHIKNFFDLVGQNKYSLAIEELPASKLLKEDTAFNSKLETKLNMLGLKSGEYCGYELIEKEEVSASYMVLSYYIKYLYFPQKIQFTFYKPRESWQLTQVALNIQNRPAANTKKQGFRK
jgi:hypothetical protein